MAVHYLINILFHAAWGVFMIAETARMGSQSSPACDNTDVSDALKPVCNGLGAGAAFSFFAFVAAAAAAGLSKAGGVRVWYAFLGSVSLYALAKVCETGGLSGFNCHDDVDVSELCDGYSAAAVFYFFAFATAVLVVALIAKWADSKHFSVSAFFAFLTLYAIGVLCEFGGLASQACNQDDTNVKEIDDSRDAQCNGYSFATFVAAMAMCAGAAYAGLSYMKKDTGSNLWIGFSVWFSLYMLIYTTVYGVQANIDCDINKDASAGTDEECSGEGSATFFNLLGLITALGAVFFSFRGHEGFKQLTFLATFSMFYLAYTCYLGGLSAGSCADRKDLPSGAKGYGVDVLDAECSGYGAAAFFAFVAFLVAIVSSVLTQTTHGAPQPEDGDKAPAPQEANVPTAPAVPVNEKDGADV